MTHSAAQKQAIYKRLVFGLGSGCCGLTLLSELLNRQQDTSISFYQPPLLPWQPTESSLDVEERIRFLLARRPSLVAGDIASSYLPYLEKIIGQFPSTRAIVLRRPKDETAASFSQQLDQHPPIRYDHWSYPTPDGFERHPVWSRIYPDFDTTTRDKAIERYWDHYYEHATSLAKTLPQNVRVFDANTIGHKDGIRELLTFAGYPLAEQVVENVFENKENKITEPQQARAPTPSNDPYDPRRCVILVPFSGFIHPSCEESLRELERRGYIVRRVGGYAAIDQGRNQMATDAICDGFQETMWIDSDISFHPDAIERLRRLDLPISCGLYPQKSRRAIAAHVVPGTKEIEFGANGDLIELLYGGTGFVHVRREVYMKMQHELGLPVCNERFDRPMIPYFQPMTIPLEGGDWYLAEDYSFCHRARECGFRIVGDPVIRLWHIGNYHYGWEDAGSAMERFANYKLTFPKGKPLC